MTSWEYDWKISIYLRSLMRVDDAHIEYGKEKSTKSSTPEQKSKLAEMNAKITAGLKNRKKNPNCK